MPAEADSAIEIAPSAAYDEASAPRLLGSREDRAKALARGTLVHRLLQSLPDMAPADREAAAHRYLARAAGAFTGEERDAFVQAALALFADPRFAPLFAPGSRAELPIVGRFAREPLVLPHPRHFLQR